MTNRITNREIADAVANRLDFAANSTTGTTSPSRYLDSGRLPYAWVDAFRFDCNEVGLDYVVYSYGTPIAWVTRDGEVTMPDVRYSVTTSKIQTYVRQGLGL